MSSSKNHFFICLFTTLGLCALPNQALLAKTQKKPLPKKSTAPSCQTLVKNHHYAQALNACEQLANTNNKDGLYYLGMLYLQGLGTQPHQELAFTHLLRAAFQQHPQAQYQVAKLYTLGLGVTRDEQQAARWYFAAAKNKVKEAILVSSLLYRLGIGLPKNHLQAFESYELAMQQKNAGLPKLDQENFYFQQNSLSEETAGQAEFDKAMQLQIGLTPSHPSDQAEITRLLRQAADLGYPNALMALAECYHHGKGVAQNDLEAFTYYKKAALFGHPEGIFQISYRYLLGQGVPQDTQQALYWLKQLKTVPVIATAALASPATRTTTTPEVQENPPNLQESLKWFSQSAQAGNKQAQYKLGLFYLTGNGLPQNYVYSYSWLNLSSAQGLPEANQAKIYLESKMTASQLKEAQRLSEEVYAFTEKPPLSAF